MHKHEGPIDTSKGYEQSDLPIKDVTIGTIVFFVFVAACIVMAMVVLKFVPGGGIGVPEPSKTARQRQLPTEPNPLLQNNVTATVDMQRLRANEKKALESYGWVDEKKGVARIPIEVAIERAAQEGAK